MDIWKYLKETELPVVLYGMGNGADRIVEKLSQCGKSISGIFVSDGFVRNKIIHGHSLCTYGDMKKKYPRFIVLVAFGTQLPEVMENIKRISKEQEVYAPYLPVCGGDFVTDEYIQAHESDFEFVRSILCDEKSKHDFYLCMKYRLTGDIKHLFESESEKSEFYRILNLSDEEVYIDLGAYRGDTVCEFIENTCGYNRIIALEPDVKTYRKLEENTKDMQNIELYNAAVGEKSHTAFFSMQGGRQSKLSDSGRECKVLSVDDILKGDKATYIKFDVEGAEKEAIAGAKITISRYKPKMLVSAYHRTDDLFEIARQVLSIRPDYKVYFRRPPYVPDWDCAFLFV